MVEQPHIKQTVKKGSKEHYPLYRDVNTCGWDSFYVEVLDTCEDKETLNNQEEFWIAYYDTTNVAMGYNIVKGGKHTMCESVAKDIKKSKEKGTPLDKRVINITDNIIYRSAHECARVEYPNMYSKNCAIFKVCNPLSRYYFYKGKSYRYLDSNSNIVEKIYSIENSRVGKYIRCIEDDLVFESKRQAYIHYGISKSYIDKCLKLHGGFVAKINKTFKLEVSI